MSAENFHEKKPNMIITPEQGRIAVELKEIMTTKDLEIFDKKQQLVVSFARESEKKSFNPSEYLLWHIVVGSSAEGIAKFDTPDHDIENFFRSLKQFDDKKYALHTDIDNLSAEQKEQKINELKLISKPTNEEMVYEKEKGPLVDRQQRITRFNKNLKFKYGVSLNNYILGHLLLDSNPGESESLPFDIVDESNPDGMGLVEKFIKYTLPYHKTYEGDYSDPDKEYPDLNKEQNKILSEINFLKRKNNIESRANRTIESITDKYKSIINFTQELEKKGFDIMKYVLGRRLAGSTPDSYTTEFDTPNGDIADFMRKLYK